MSDLIPFLFENEHTVRVEEFDGEPWFVAHDLSKALEYRDAHSATRWLDEDELRTHIVCTNGKDREMKLVNESGLYSLIVRSRKASAKRFKKWVTSEVLPSIRKTGRYEHPSAPMEGEVLGAFKPDPVIEPDLTEKRLQVALAERIWGERVAAELWFHHNLPQTPSMTATGGQGNLFKLVPAV